MTAEQKDHAFTSGNGFFPAPRVRRRIRSAAIMAVTNHRPPASRVAAPLVALLALSSVESEAAVTFSEPFRSVSARNDKGSSHEIGTAGFGQFNESARVDWEEYWGAPANTTGRYYAVATQDSMIGLTGIAVKGSVNGTGSYEFWGDTPLLQYSRSNFRIHISIDSPCNLYLNGTVICTLDAQGSNLDLTEMSIALSGADGDVYSRNFFPLSDYVETFEINEAFTSLEAGDYVFEVSAETNGYYSFGDSSTYPGPGYGGLGMTVFDITLVPEPSIMVLWSLGGLLVLTRRAR